MSPIYKWADPGKAGVTVMGNSTESTEPTPPVAAHGKYTTHGIPHGSTSITPFLALASAKEAIAFYRDVFGAHVVDVTEIDGVVVHPDLGFGQGQLQLGEPNPAYHLVPAPAGEDDCYSLGLCCSDVDALTERAASASCHIRTRSSPL